MNFDLTNEQIQVRDMVREFAAREVAPTSSSGTPRASSTRGARQDGRARASRAADPEEYGGAGFDYVSLALACEELEYVDTFLRVVMSVHVGLNSLALLQWGTEAQKQRWLVPQATGEKIATFGLTEPNAGSDAGRIESTVVPRRRRLRPQRLQDVDLPRRRRRPLPRLRQRDRSRKHAGLTAFVVERGMEGFTTASIKGKLGVRAGNTGELGLQQRPPLGRAPDRRGGRGLQDRDELYRPGPLHRSAPARSV
jgi:glutaryl-CoA dehydrogenase (non-decarboxylating)